MSLTIEQALELVPKSAPNREALARLLIAARDALSDIERETVHAKWRVRLRSISFLLAAVESAPKGTRERSRAERKVRAAIEAARKYASRNNLKPDSRSGVLERARLLRAAAP
ncbi:MAG: hypothetical protein M3Z20_00890 [Chloroflexota bacterium]|nr:hypothetical protein [Chloroflexota bacterium]